jgi:hypothetical protein
MALLHPYRRPPASRDATAGEERRDDYVLAALLVFLGGWRVVLALATDEPFGTEPTIAAIMTALGVVTAVAAAVRR